MERKALAKKGVRVVVCAVAALVWYGKLDSAMKTLVNKFYL